MKKSVLPGVLIIFLLFAASFVIAAENDTNETIISLESTSDEFDAKDKAYECLENKVEGECSTLSLEEQIFSLLSIGECENEVKDNSNDNKCWPSSGCNLKQTAQAILALDNSNENIDEAKDWLISQNMTPTDLEWFLEIESSDATSCSIKYSGATHNINIGSDKKINTNAGNCLSLYEGNYWFKISSGCYREEFEISCNSSFLTTLLFKKQGSSTIHVLEKTNSASEEGITKEKIESSCFGQNSRCDYEGSLWSAMVLDSLGEDISSYIPYLVTAREGNERYLPESFLYMITGYSDFRNDLLLKQIGSKFWRVSGDKYYDTALALLPFQYEDPLEKTDAKNWLLEVQNSDGCWEGNTRNTAFILYSLWPKNMKRSSSGGGETGGSIDCEDAGYYCMSGVECGGDILSSSTYSCAGIFRCCDTPASVETCIEQGGEICNSNQECIGGRTDDAVDVSYGQTCCIRGACGEPQERDETSECVLYSGTCKVSGCGSGEKESLYECNFGDTCCVKDDTSSKQSYWWVWLLLLLIILIIVAIIFRDKLRPYYLRIKSKFGKGKTPPRKPGTPPFGFPRRMPMRRPPQRRIPHPVQRQQPPIKQPVKPKPRNKEMDDVLKKLKEMGK